MVPEIDIYASKRVPFDDTIPELLVDYSGATASMQVRAEPGDSGAAIITLGMSVAGSEGLTIEYDATYPDPRTDEEVGATIVGIIIDEATLEGLSLGADTADDVTLHYDIHLTPSGGKKFVYCAGRFVVQPGVTQ